MTERHDVRSAFKRLVTYPDAWIYECDEFGIRRVAYEKTAHYRVTRDFLNRPKVMLHHLLKDEPGDLELS